MPANRQCPHCGNAVKPALTPKRRRRHVENDEYADFLRRALHGYTRRVAGGDIDALASFGEAVFFLRLRGYSWTDIGIRLGTTRQAAQQRWGTQP